MFNGFAVCRFRATGTEFGTESLELLTKLRNNLESLRVGELVQKDDFSRVFRGKTRFCKVY